MQSGLEGGSGRGGGWRERGWREVIHFILECSRACLCPCLAQHFWNASKAQRFERFGVIQAKRPPKVMVRVLPLDTLQSSI